MGRKPEFVRKKSNFSKGLKTILPKLSLQRTLDLAVDKSNYFGESPYSPAPATKLAGGRRGREAVRTSVRGIESPPPRMQYGSGALQIDPLAGGRTITVLISRWRPKTSCIRASSPAHLRAAKFRRPGDTHACAADQPNSPGPDVATGSSAVVRVPSFVTPARGSLRPRGSALDPSSVSRVEVNPGQPAWQV